MQKKEAIYLFIIFFLIILSASIVIAGNCGGATICYCADAVTSSYTLPGPLNVSATDASTCTGSGLNITANNIVLDCAGYNITGDGGTTDYGIYLLNGRSNNTIKNCEIINFGIGVYLLNGISSNNIILNNTLKNNRDGVTIITTTAGGHYNNTIENNTFQSCGRYGIYLWTGSNKTIARNNRIYDPVSYGFYLRSDMPDNNILNSIINGTSTTGIYILAGNDYLIQNNTIKQTKVAGATPISGAGGTNATIKDNFINSSATNCISLFSNNNLVQNNDITSCTGRGIWINESNNIIKGNSIHDLSFSFGIVLEGSNNNNSCINNTIFLTGGDAIDVSNGNNLNISQNTIYNVTIGIDANALNNPFIQGNNISKTSSTGIDMDAGTNNSQIRDNIIYSLNNQIGIQSAGTNHSFINNTIYLTGNTGISITAGNNHNISQNIIYNITDGISATASNSTVYNNNITWVTGSNIAIAANGNNNKVFNNNIFYTYKGISITSNNSIAYNNNIDCSSISGAHGILQLNGYNQTAYSNNISNCPFGLLWETHSHNGTGYNNLIKSSTSKGIFLLHDVSHCEIYDNTIQDSRYGIFLLDKTDNNTIRNNTIPNATYSGIIVAEFGGEELYLGGIPRGNKLIDNKIYNLKYAFTFENSSETEIINNTLANISVLDIWAYNNSLNTIVLNTTINTSQLSINDTSNFTLQWYLEVKVQDTLGNNITNATVNITTFQNTSSFYDLTNNNASTGLQALSERTYNSTGTHLLFTPYNITANKTGYAANSTSYNITSSSSFIIILENLAPEVTINSPTETTYAANSIDFNITLNEDGYCEFSLDSGVNNVTMTNNGNRDFNYTNSSIEDGSYTMNAYCNDTLGEQNYTESVSFSISTDSIAPNVTVIYPAAGQFFAGSVEFNLSAVDDSSSVSSCWYSLNSGVGNYTMSNVSASAWNATNASIADGSYTANFYCNDTKNNINNSESVSFNVDAAPPIITINYPVNDSKFNAGSSGFNVSLNENASWCGISVSGGANATMTINASNTGADYTNSSIADGNYTFVVNCNDTMNNYGTSEVYNFLIDTVYPDISIIYPPTGLNTSDINTDVNYTVSDNNLQACWYSNDTFIGNVSLTCGINVTAVVWSEGQHNVTIWANDSAGNENSSSISFNVDTLSPGVTINSPSNGETIKVPSIDFNITLNEDGYCEFSLDSGVNNVTMTNNGNRDFNYTNSSITNGTYTMNAYCNDTTGNKNYTETLTFNLSFPPSVTLLSPADSYSETSSSATINFQFNVTDESDIANCTLYLSSIEYQNTSVINKSNTNTISVAAITPAAYSWSVNCTNTLNNIGNSSTQTLTITAPTITASTTPSTGGGIAQPKEWVNTFTYDNEELIEKEPLEKELGEKNRIKILISNETHYIGISKISNKTATIEVSSTPQTSTLNIGESKKFEITNDNLYDLKVTLNNIKDNKANITIEGIKEKIPQLPSEKQIPIASKIETIAELPKKLFQPKPLIYAGISAMIILIILTIWIIHKKRKSRSIFRQRITPTFTNQLSLTTNPL